jgi:lipopolysaccharide cholinephosphotransferase
MYQNINEEKKLYHGRKKINKEIAGENLRETIGVFNKYEITYGLIFGTLLGAIREKDFIEHDEDIDLYFFYEQREKVLNIVDEIVNLGFEIVRNENNLVSIMRHDEYIDLYFFEEITSFLGDKMRTLNYNYEIKSSYLENPVSIDFRDFSVPIPSESIIIIEKLYGQDWRIPKINAFAEPNTNKHKISKYIPVRIRMIFGSLFKKYIYRIIR